MNLLVNIVSRTLECPAAFIGIMDDSSMWVKASVGLDERITHIPRDGCVCAHTVLQDCTMIVDDTSADKHFHAGGDTVGSNSMRYYAGTPIRVRGHGIGVVCALDTKPHATTTDAMKSTLEAVANIVSEVLEQRVAADGTMNSPADVRAGGGLSCYRRRPEHTYVDLHASLHGLNLLPPSRQAASTSDTNSIDKTHPSSYLQRQYAYRITSAMDYFHQLQRSTWTDQNADTDLTNNGSISTFELYSKGKRFTRSIMKMTGDCQHVATHILNYEDALLYQQLFQHASDRRELSEQTWLDSVILHPSFSPSDEDNLRVLTHRREYPDGSNVVVAVSENNPEQVSEKDLMFGWFIVPCNRGDDESFATVSCITAQSFRSQPIDQNLSLDLLRRLNQKLAMARFFHLPSDAPCIKPSALRIKLPPAAAGNQNTLEGVNSVSSSDDSGLDLHSSERDSTVANTSGSVDYASRNTCTFQPEDNRAALVAIHQSGQTSELNQNEQMLLDLLDKTISTQEILAQRQNEMAGVLDTHGDQLQRLSVALERVEALLALKKLARKAKQASTTA
ncbi:DNA ligase 1 [Phytophthora cinnamomi]|uniref:DNA ligase 1 n=1 Tax=Phytophthora cinnamomi TaxID=4785 RepID=UPI0035595B0F|nr:DNA ligase 1 [Phytophthora cinnamomi]